MASNLLKTFEKIESQRKYAIDLANRKGFNLLENASIAELGNCIYQLDPTKPDLTDSVWERPSDWPDCESILLNAEPINGLHPGYIVLIKAERESIEFSKYSISTSAVNTVSITDPTTLTSEYSRGRQHCAKGILTSDGQWYDTTSTSWQHTWDTSKDIQTESEGPLRYFIAYVDDTPIEGWCINYYEPLEIIIGNIKAGRQTYSSMISLIIWDNNLGPRTSWDYKRNLKRIKELPISNGGNPWKLTNTGMGGRYLQEPNLKEVIFNNITEVVSSPSSRAYMFDLDMSIEVFIAPNYYSKYIYLPPSLKILNVPIFYVDQTKNNGTYLLTELPSYNNCTTAEQGMRFPYVRKITEISGNPDYWPKLIEEVGVKSIGSYTVKDKPHLRSIRYKSVLSTSYIYKLGPGLPKLSSLNFVEGAFKVKTFDIGEVDLNLDCLINVISGLADVNGSSTTHTIILGSNVNKLSQANINDIAGKGWVVE